MEIIVDIWHQYPSVLEFMLYFLFFGALVRTALKGHFGENGARMLAVPIGLVLAAALKMGQAQTGFLLENLGPLAVGMIVVVLFVLVFRLLRFVDVPARSSFLLATLFALISLRAAAPEFLPGSLNLSEEWLLLGLIVSGLAVWFVPGSDRKRDDAARRGRNRNRFANSPGPSPLDLKRVAKLIEYSILGEGKADVFSSKKAVKLLREAKDEASSKKNDEQEAHLDRLLDEIEVIESRLSAHLARIRRINKAITEADWVWLRKSLDAPAITETQKRVFRRNIAVEKSRLKIEENIERLATITEKREDQVRVLIAQVRVEPSEYALKRVAQLNAARRIQRNVLRTEKLLLAVEKKLLLLFARESKNVEAA